MKNTYLKIPFIFFLSISSLLAQYDQEWEIDGNMPVPVAGGQAVYFNDAVYIFGGYSDSTEAPIDVIQRFDPFARKDARWKVAGHMQVARANFVADVFQDQIFLVGGATGFRYENVVNSEFWSDTDERMQHTDGRLNRIDATGGIVGDKLYLFGGYAGLDTPLPYAVEFDIKKQSITVAEEWFKGVPPYQQSSVKFKNQFFLFGGVRNGVSRDIMTYYVSSHKLETVHPSLQQPRAASAAVITREGNIYIIGGYNESHKALASVEKFQATGFSYSIEQSIPLQEPRAGAMAVYVPYSDYGMIYVFGGKDENGDVRGTFEKYIVRPPMTVVNDREQTPSFILQDNYPNPFNNATTIEFSLAEEQHVRLDIYFANGRYVRTLVNGVVQPGTHRFLWSGTDNLNKPVPGGIYFYCLSTESQNITRKMVLVK